MFTIWIRSNSFQVKSTEYNRFNCAGKIPALVTIYKRCWYEKDWARNSGRIDWVRHGVHVCGMASRGENEETSLSVSRAIRLPAWKAEIGNR